MTNLSIVIINMCFEGQILPEVKTAREVVHLETWICGGRDKTERIAVAPHNLFTQYVQFALGWSSTPICIYCATCLTPESRQDNPFLLS